MEGPIRQKPIFSNPDRSRLTLGRGSSEHKQISNRLQYLRPSELAVKMGTSKLKRSKVSTYIILDCREACNFSKCHIKGAVNLPCDEKFLKNLQQSNSISDLIPQLGHFPSPSCHTYGTASTLEFPTSKLREMIIYDDGKNDFEKDSQSNLSVLISRLIQEAVQPFYLIGGLKEFEKSYSDLCDSVKGISRKAEALEKDTEGLIKSNKRTKMNCPILILPPAPSFPVSIKSCESTLENFENEPPTMILPFLYVGNVKDSTNYGLLEELGIKYVLSLTAGSSSNGSEAKDQTSGANMESYENKLIVKRIQVLDNLCENLSKYFDESIDFIESAKASNSKVLIHCHAGISRSPTIAIAYIMKYFDMSALAAYAFVQKRRNIISPNLNFMGQLVEFESRLKNANNNSSNSYCFFNSYSSSSHPAPPMASHEGFKVPILPF